MSFAQKSPALEKEPCRLPKESCLTLTLIRLICQLPQNTYSLPKESYVCCPKSPIACQKRPTVCQKSPIVCQRLLFFYQKTRVLSSCALTRARACALFFSRPFSLTRAGELSLSHMQGPSRLPRSFLSHTRRVTLDPLAQGPSRRTRGRGLLCTHTYTHKHALFLSFFSFSLSHSLLLSH